VEPSTLVKHVERAVERVMSSGGGGGGGTPSVRLQPFSTAGSGPSAATLPPNEACLDVCSHGNVLVASTRHVVRCSSSPQLGSPLSEEDASGAPDDGDAAPFRVVGHVAVRSHNTRRLLEVRGGAGARAVVCRSADPVRLSVGTPTSLRHLPFTHPPLTHPQACAAGLRSGQAPKLEAEGLGGTYLLRGEAGERLAMFKPLDEEPFAPNNPKGFVGKQLGAPGVSRAVRVGEAAFREVAAFVLDHGRFSRVPRTALVRVHHRLATFHVNSSSGAAGLRRDTSPGAVVEPPTTSAVAVPKLGSLQAYVRHDYDASEHGTSRFPAVEVHRLGILDVRLYNTDRHTGNILVCRRSSAGGGPPAGGIAAALEGDSVELVPIDHGYCLPEALESVYFEWLHWPQASMPFSKDTLAFIARLDGDADARLLARELPSLRPGCGRLIQLTTRTLQAAAAAGLCLADIGSLLSRPVVRIGEEPSQLEKLVEASLAALAAQVASDAASTAAEALADASGAAFLPPVSVGGGEDGWGEEYPLGELSEGDEDAAGTPAAASHGSLPPTPAGGIARALASAAKSPQAAQGGSSLTALLQSAGNAEEAVEEEEEGGFAFDVDDPATGTDDLATSPSCTGSDSLASPAGTPRRTLVAGFAAPGDSGAAGRRGALVPGTPSAQPVPVPMRRTHSMPLNMPMGQSHVSSLGDDVDGTGGGSSTSSSFGMSGPDSPAHHYQQRHVAGGGGHHHHRRNHQQQQQQARRGGVSSAPKHAGGALGNPGQQFSAAAPQSAAPRRVVTTSGQLMGRSVGALHASGLLSAPHRQPTCPPSQCSGAGAPGASSVPALAASADAAAAGASPPVALPWTSFSEVPQCHWRSFLRLFEHHLAALLDAHPACRRPRGGAGAGVAEAGEQRGSQLVTRGGTRVEAFGTSCPSAWLADRQRRTGAAGGW
jgi:hypothetical protein